MTFHFEHLQQLIQALAQGKSAGMLNTPEQRLSFQELAQAAIERANELRQFQAQRLVLVAEHSPDFIMALLACWQAQALPLVIDSWQASQQGWLQSLGAQALWWHGSWQKFENSLPGRSEAWEEADPQVAALVLFTSGSSGLPKGVVMSHAGILANIQAVAANMELAEPASVAIMLPLHHSFALITQLLLTLATGGDIHLLPPQWLPGERLEYLQAQRIQRLAGVPTHFRLLLDQAGQLPNLKHIKVAGAALEQSLAQQIRQACPAARLWVGYGLTEAGPRVSAISDVDPRFFSSSVGQALEGVELRLRNEVLEIKSPALMLGYLDQPEVTAAVLQGGWLSSGDRASLEAGYLYILGRQDDIFQVAGEKIAPLEIEGILLGHPQIRAVAVYGQPDALLGNQIAALVQGEASLADLRRYARQQLPPEKRPQSWYAVSELPLTPNGKLKRKELPQWPKVPFTSRP